MGPLEEHHRPDVTDRERCEGVRKCGGDTDRRGVARAAIAREPEGTWTALREAGVRETLSSGRIGER